MQLPRNDIPITPMISDLMTTNNASVLPLFIWLSPSFPVGAFAYSHGIEYAVEAGAINTGEDLSQWLQASLCFGAGRTDAILLAHGWRAAGRQDIDELSAINELALALSPSAERYLEASAQGHAFVRALALSWPCPVLEKLARDHETISYPIAIATAAAHYHCALELTLKCFLIAFVSNLISACVRLGPIGQTEGQKIIAACVPLIETEVAKIINLCLDDIGSSTLRFDLASLRHETQYSRLFRS
jgi:urease accessory protein